MAWSYVLTYATSFFALGLLPMIPWQKAEAHRRKNEWKNNSFMATLVLVAGLLYFMVLSLNSKP